MCQEKLLKKACANTISTLHSELKKKFKITCPKITVTGLNPHSGEDGEFGDEEIRIIRPAIKKMQEFRYFIKWSYSCRYRHLHQK
jgi:4-hydroxy-L-threonine phosphate dehydrogenase PdxA